MLQPKKTKFRRPQKGTMKGNAGRGNQLAFGSFGIKALQSKWITGRQIEAARIAVTRYMQRQGQVWVRIFPDKPITKKPAVTVAKPAAKPAGAAPAAVVAKPAAASGAGESMNISAANAIGSVNATPVAMSPHLLRKSLLIIVLYWKWLISLK